LQESAFTRFQMPFIYMCHFKHKKGGIQMLSYETVEPRTMELLKSLMQEPAFNEPYLFRHSKSPSDWWHVQSDTAVGNLTLTSD